MAQCSRRSSHSRGLALLFAELFARQSVGMLPGIGGDMWGVYTTYIYI